MTGYWGCPPGYDSLGMRTRWKVRKARGLTAITVWSAYMPDGTWSGDFYTFREALQWATDPFVRLTYWLENQT